MNRAQVGDAQWVRDRFPERHNRQRCPTIDRPARDPVTHLRQTPQSAPPAKNGTGKRILAILAKATEPLRSPEIGRVLGLTVQQVGGNIAKLHHRRAVTRKRVYRGFAYTITSAGRAEL